MGRFVLVTGGADLSDGAASETATASGCRRGGAPCKPTACRPASAPPSTPCRRGARTFKEQRKINTSIMQQPLLHYTCMHDISATTTPATISGAAND